MLIYFNKSLALGRRIQASSSTRRGCAREMAVRLGYSDITSKPQSKDGSHGSQYSSGREEQGVVEELLMIEKKRI